MTGKKYVAAREIHYVPDGKRSEVTRNEGDPVDDLPKHAKIKALEQAGFIREAKRGEG